jgi:ubiquinone biosynthesis protein COQ4
MSTSSSGAINPDGDGKEEPFYGRPRSASGGATSSSWNTVQERLAIAIISASTAFLDPTRADSVAALGDVTSPVTLQRIRDRMVNDPTGRQILIDRPVVSKATIPYERLISEAPTTIDDDDDDGVTFGHAYGSFLKIHGFDPDERDEVRFVEDETLAYIMLRYRQCHDYWHALTGLPPTVLGELGIKWLELFNTGLPVAALSATVGALRLRPEERDILLNLYLPWALKQASNNGNGNNDPNNNVPFLMNVYYEKEFDTPLKDLRRRLRIEAAPKVHLKSID